jgi:hypothetical protein
MTDDTNAARVAEDYARMILQDVEGADDPADAAAEYVHDALDADYVVTSRGDVKGVHLVVGTGGPHVEVHHYLGSEHLTVRAAWWSPTAEYGVHAPTLAAELEGLGEAWQDAYVMTGRGSAGVHR